MEGGVSVLYWTPNRGDIKLLLDSHAGIRFIPLQTDIQKNQLGYLTQVSKLILSSREEV